ncbi:MAG: M24 family metallopeptidase [Ignavibacteriales bacterium]|nr:M24 family metallopeptidase [Ignavibacteriales bacterium]
MKDMDSKAKEVITQAGYGKYIRHGVTHPLGIDAHDIWASDITDSWNIVISVLGLKMMF